VGVTAIYWYFCFSKLLGIVDCVKNTMLHCDDFNLEPMCDQFNEFHAGIGYTKIQQVMSPQMIQYLDALVEYALYYNDVGQIDGGSDENQNGFTRRMNDCVKEHESPKAREYILVYTLACVHVC
jgi:hypothetical protein